MTEQGVSALFQVLQWNIWVTSVSTTTSVLPLSTAPLKWVVALGGHPQLWGQDGAAASAIAVNIVCNSAGMFDADFFQRFAETLIVGLCAQKVWTHTSF